MLIIYCGTVKSKGFLKQTTGETRIKRSLPKEKSEK